MTIKQNLVIFDYQCGQFSLDNGKSGTWHRVGALRRPSEQEKEKGCTGLCAYDRNDDGVPQYFIKIPDKIRDQFPSFANLPGLYEFEFVLEGGRLKPISAVNIGNYKCPE